MLKKVLISLISVLVLAGCGKNNVELDLTKVETELNKLEYEENATKAKLFENNITLEEEQIEGRGIDTNLFEEILFSISSKPNEASIYIVYIPKKGEAEECSSQIDNYLNSLQDNATLYSPEAANLIKNRTVETYGNYYIYAISHDNDSVVKTIKNMK